MPPRAKIKTREVVRDIKIKPAAPRVGAQMKRAALKTKEAAARQLNESQTSPNEYAGDVVEEKSKAVGREAAQTLDSQGRKAAQKLRERPRLEVAEKPVPEAPGTPEAPTSDCAKSRYPSSR
jgi:hypothetical protein